MEQPVLTRKQRTTNFYNQHQKAGTYEKLAVYFQQVTGHPVNVSPGFFPEGEYWYYLRASRLRKPVPAQIKELQAVKPTGLPADCKLTDAQLYYLATAPNTVQLRTVLGDNLFNWMGKQLTGHPKLRVWLGLMDHPKGSLINPREAVSWNFPDPATEIEWITQTPVTCEDLYWFLRTIRRTKLQLAHNHQKPEQYINLATEEYNRLAAQWENYILQLTAISATNQTWLIRNPVTKLNRQDYWWVLQRLWMQQDLPCYFPW